MRSIANASVQELMQISGIGRRIALTLVSAFELAKRKNIDEQKVSKITSSKDVAQYLISKYAHNNREVFIVLFLNRANKIVAEEEMFVGGISSVVVDPRLIFKQTISHLASGIILAHSHPSGNLKPSLADIEITEKIVQAGAFLDIVVLDHIIISHTGYYSFADDRKI